MLTQLQSPAAEKSPGVQHYENHLRVYRHYVDKARSLVAMYPRCVVLKTDGWNETLSDCRCGFEFDIPVLGQIGAEEEHCIEILPDRARQVRDRVPGAKIVTGDLTKHEYSASLFHVILDLSTIDHIHPKDIETVLRKYRLWLRSQGTLWLCVWLNHHARWRDVPVDPNPGHQYYFERMDFEATLEASGFLFAPPELLMGSEKTVGLFSYVARKGYR